MKLKQNWRVKIMFVVQLFWLTLVLFLGAWWSSLVVKQANTIADLEAKLGISPNLANEASNKTQRMLFWESLTFFGLLIAISLILFWLYWRDQKRTRSLQAFFASVTHELRTPLTSIRLQAESISDASKKNADFSTLLSRLLEDTTRLESQVERTLELARVEGGGAVFNQNFEIRPSVERFLRTLSDPVKSRLNVKTSIDDCVIRADISAFQVILRNLFENSARHSAEKRKDFESIPIEISTRESTPGWVVLGYRDKMAKVDANLKDLGQLFQKGTHSTGTGVGLYLVRTLMEKMGGSVEFNTDAGFEAVLHFKASEQEL